MWHHTMRIGAAVEEGEAAAAARVRRLLGGVRLQRVRDTVPGEASHRICCSIGPDCHGIPTL